MAAAVVARERVDLRATRMRSLALTLLSAVLLCSARAQASDLALDWQAPPGCPGAAELQASLRSRLGRQLRFGPDAPTRLDAHVTREAGSFKLELNTRTESGAEQRTLDARSCNELARVTLLVASLLLSTPPVPPPRDPSLDASSSGAGGSGASPSAPNPRGYLHLTLTAALDLGRLPAPAPGVAARLGVDAARLRIAAGALYLPAQARTLAAQPGASVSVQLTAAQLALCYALIVSPWLGACAFGELGALVAEGHGLPQTQRASSLWLAAGTGLALSLPLVRWLELAAEASASVPAVRAELSVRDLGRVYRVSGLAAQLQLGLRARFP